MNDSTLSDRFGDLTAEHLLLVGLIVLSTWMFVESFTFREPSGLFPRFAAAITIAGSVLLLLNPYLPKSVQSFVMESADMFESYEDELDDLTQSDIDELEMDDVEGISDERLEEKLSTEEVERLTSEEDEGFNLSFRWLYDNKRFMLSALTTVYVVASYLIGFLIASPVFVLAYSLYVGHSRRLTAMLIMLSFAVVWGFMQLLNVPLNRGVLIG